ATGIVNTDFGSFDVLNSIAVTGDGKIYAGGLSSDGVAYNHFRIARYNSDGSLDADFSGGSVFLSNGNVYENLTALKLQPDGKIVASGSIDAGVGNQNIEVARLNADGTPDL